MTSSDWTVLVCYHKWQSIMNIIPWNWLSWQLFWSDIEYLWPSIMELYILVFKYTVHKYKWTKMIWSAYLKTTYLWPMNSLSKRPRQHSASLKLLNFTYVRTETAEALSKDYVEVICWTFLVTPSLKPLITNLVTLMATWMFACFSCLTIHLTQVSTFSWLI